jgi:meso-butanediol dehydrogenase / (S,S)-butanediol dehydrogenase / diacetyl reductase
MTRFSGKVVIVTGGASGIGAATAARFASEGALVTVADLNEPASLPAGALFVQVDVTDEAQVIAMVEQTVAQRGKLDCIVNNAGIGAAMPTAMLPRESWEKVFAVNSTGVFLGCKAAIPHLEATRGNIVNVASISGLGGDYLMSAYNASKGAVVNFTRSLAMECAEIGVRVNAVCPGVIQTPLAAGGLERAEDRDHWMERVPLHRPGQPEDIAAAIAFLASDDASYITGHNLVVDGGITAHTGQPNFIRRQALRAQGHGG